MTATGGKRVAGWALVCVLIMHVWGSMALASSSLAVKKALFQKADQAMQEADTNKTRFFAPKLFGDAMDLFKSAENDYAHERSMKEINDKLDQCIDLFRAAAKTANEAERLFRDTDLARIDAHKVMASRYKATQWAEAENMFKRAITKYERGDRDEALAFSQQAADMYRKVEQDTITYSYLAGVWDTLKKIETMKAGEHYAPKTYTRALALAEQAQAELERQTYGNEKAKTLIREAQAQAEYGLQLSRFIKTMKDEGKTLEDMFLEDLIPRESLERVPPRS